MHCIGERFKSNSSLNQLIYLFPQITNGGSDLSMSLAYQLACIHKCKVILVKEPSPNNNNEARELGYRISSNVSTFECDILASSQLDQLSKTIDKHYPGIDLIIDNGLVAQLAHQNVDDFITITSNKLRATINVRFSISSEFSDLSIHFSSQLLMFFVPKMKYSSNGHVVSIQSTSSDTPTPLLDTQGEIQRVVQLLTTVDSNRCHNETEHSAETTKHNVNVQLTTVLCDQSIERYNANSENGKMNLSNVAGRIISGIQRDRSLIQIKESKSLIQSIFHFFSKII